MADHLISMGNRTLQGWRRAAEEKGLRLKAGGLSSLIDFELDYSEAHALTTLFTQLMLDRGYLAFHQFKPSLAHTKEDVDRYLQDVTECFGLLAEAVHRRDAHRRLSGAVAGQTFERLT